VAKDEKTVTAPDCHVYRIAGQSITSNTEIVQAGPFREPCRGSLELREVGAAASGALVFRGPALVGGHLRVTECRQHPSGYWLRVAGGAACLVGDHELHVLASPGAEREATQAALVGPALVLSLAQALTFCLHASANAMASGGCVAFVGPSGRGKSTLAKLLLEAGWPRLCDDILPVALTGEVVAALPSFPQPSGLPLMEGTPERAQLRRVYILDPVETESEVRTSVVHGSAAVLAFAGCTVAARLFKPDLLAQHLDFCATLAERVGVRRLVYPRRLDIGPEVARVLREDLAHRNA
jgi:hypothetical protein